MTPNISIIIPLYNKEQYILETLESIKIQTYNEWEVIIVDDGSNDKSIDIVTSFCSGDERFKIIQRNVSKKGASVCRNIGIKRAKGEFIVFLDADDILESFCLEKRIDFMEQNNNLDLAVFQMGVLGNTDTRLTKYKENYLHAFLSHDLPWTMTAPIWKKNILLKLGMFNDNFPRLQDPEIHTRALLFEKINFFVLFDSEIDCWYRKGENSSLNLSNLLIGYILYIETITPLLSNRKDIDICKKHLNVTRKSAINHLIRRFDKEDRVEMVKLIMNLNNLSRKFSIISSTYSFLSIFFLSLFIMLYPITNRFIFLKINNKLL